MRAYLDHAATTPLRPEALEAMRPWLEGRYGNATGTHTAARAARAAVEEARDALAELVGFDPAGLVWTSGGTEADNLALRARRAGTSAEALVVSAVEHAAVLEPARHAGVDLRIAPVGADGLVDLAALEDLVDVGTAVVSVMVVNNETGVIQPVADVAAIAARRSRAAVVHADSVQALGWLDLAVLAAPLDALSLSGHKVGGPQGIGALALRPGIAVEPVLRGGAQERSRRAGTHNVAGIVGMAAAAVAADAEREHQAARVASLRDRLVRTAVATVPGCRQTTAAAAAPGFAHLLVEGIESETLLLLLDEAGVDAAAGASCASGAIEPSHVLLAMGIDRRDALGSLRLTLGHTSTDADVDAALSALAGAVHRLRRSPAA